MPTRTSVRIGLIGDRSAAVKAHVNAPIALAGCARRLGIAVEPVWFLTDSPELRDHSHLRSCRGLWVVPACPYEDPEAVLSATRLARRERIPFLDTCGGFQHMILEFARSVAGIADAQHAEEHPNARTPVIAPLSCSLVGRDGAIVLQPGSRAAAAYGAVSGREQYHCNFGLNPAYAETLRKAGLAFTGHDDESGVRVAELADHPFYIGTLFQPELSSTLEKPHEVIASFVRAASASAGA